MQAWASIALALIMGVTMGIYWGYRAGVAVGKRRECSRIARLVGNKTTAQIAQCIIEGKDFLVGRPIPNDRKKAPVSKLTPVPKPKGETTH